MGGVPSFFIDRYEKYSWKHLFNTKLGVFVNILFALSVVLYWRVSSIDSDPIDITQRNLSSRSTDLWSRTKTPNGLFKLFLDFSMFRFFNFVSFAMFYCCLWEPFRIPSWPLRVPKRNRKFPEEILSGPQGIPERSQDVPEDPQEIPNNNQKDWDDLKWAEMSWHEVKR